MAYLSRRNFFRVLPAAPVAIVAAGSPSFDEQLAGAIAKIDAVPVTAPALDGSAAEIIRSLLDGRYLGRAGRTHVDPVKDAEYEAAVDEHYRYLEARLSGGTSRSTSELRQATSPECVSSPDTAVTCRASEGAA
jgi:hypothetical protein